MSFQTKKRLCYLLIIILIVLLFLPWKLQHKEQPEGTVMVKEDFLTFHRLVNCLLEERMEGEIVTIFEEAEEIVTSWKDEEVDYGRWKLWLDKLEEEMELLSAAEEEEMEKKYSRSLMVVKEDVEPYMEKVYQQLDDKKEIVYQSLILLGNSENVRDLESNPMEEELIFTDNGKWRWEAKGREIPLGWKINCLTFRGGIWSVSSKTEAVLKNSWLVESDEDSLICFYNNYYIDYENLSLLQKEREQVADIVFKEGKPSELRLKEEKISGKVLKLSEQEVELTEHGSFPLAEDIQYYRLHGPLTNIGRNEIPLGYDFTDFIIEEGKVQAVLLVKDEKMESLRVLLKTPDFQGYFHPEIKLYSEVDMEIIWGSNKEVIKAGDLLEITPDSKYFENSRIYLVPGVLTGRTYFPELNRKNQGQGYLGSFEIEKREEGLLLVNEVLLEEYLYAVVPSEMPGYYPMEALKAQAISARTYAYQRMKTPGLSSYGANVDDSSTYQVYNNISENSNTTRAVRETKGKLLYAGEQTAETYYYSTSCGYGADASVWSKEGKNPHDYLKAREMAAGKEPPLLDLKKEKNFESFITTKSESHFESGEAWYRWTYSHDNMEIIKEKLETRLHDYPQYVSFFHKEEGMVFQAETAVIEAIEVKERMEGGTIHCLWISTNQGVVEVKNEYHVRAVLADGEAVVTLQDGNTYACNQLLPSSFFLITTKKEKDKVTGIELLGGGFGHGVGMSQNGAKNLAKLGYGAEQILTFYYQGCRVGE